MKIFLLSFLLAILFTSNNTRPIEMRPTVDMEKTRTKAMEAREFCRSKNFNTEFCILIDMGLHSGIKRFFVWDLKGDSIVSSYLVGHGSCDGPWKEDLSKETPRFSNVEGSHCSSMGKYRIGERAHSDWGIGIKYVLHGLEPTNSNAQMRYVVFHSWEMVPDEEPYPDGTPEGWGCPIVSNNAMRLIDPQLKASPKPVLMWIYE